MSTNNEQGFVERLRALWLAEDISEVDQRRIHQMRLLGCLALVLVGGGWSLFFAFKGIWPIAAMFLLSLPVAFGVFSLARRHKMYAANMLMFGIGIVSMTVATLVWDVPTAGNQRSIHLFLLPLGVAAFLTFRANRIWVSYGIAGLCFAIFLALTASSWAPLPEYRLSEDIRTVAKWINGVTVGFLLLTVLHILNSDATQHSDMHRALQVALQEQQFVLYYQPQLDQHQRVTSAEVLIRWQHPQHGLMPPGFFIDHAERCGLMVPLGQWILEQACMQLKKWRSDPLLSHLELAVNVSQTQFRQVTFASDVLGTVIQHGINPQLLELELTETLMVLDMDDLHSKMRLLREEGLRFSLDDFGTGFSSLSHLRQLPLHTLKIDRSFVKDLPDDANSKTIVRSLLGLAESMELTVVAEGIETQAQYEFLAKHGCPRFQGYLFSKPLPLDDFTAFVKTHNTSASSTKSSARVAETV